VAAIPGLHAVADTVYALGIGDETLTAPPAEPWAPLDVPLLEGIADDGPPGHYINVIEAFDLSEILNDIFQEISQCASITGRKFDDGDANGPSEGDSGLAGINIILVQEDTIVASTTTGGDGSFTFVDLQPGTYLLCEDVGDEGRAQTFPPPGAPGTVEHPLYGRCYEVTTEAGGVSTGLDFYNYVPATFTPAPTETPTSTPTGTPPPTLTPTNTPTSTPANTATPIPTNTPTNTPPNTATATSETLPTDTATAVPPTATATPTFVSDVLAVTPTGGTGADPTLPGTGSGTDSGTYAWLAAAILSAVAGLAALAWGMHRRRA
jgi:hypothetical protein